MKDIEDNSVDLILCDLPFGTTQCKWDSVIDLNKLWLQYKRVIKPTGAIVLNAQAPFDKVLGASNLKMLRYEWIWEKTAATGHLNAHYMPMKAHENVLVFYKKRPTYNPQMTKGHKLKSVSTATASKSNDSNSLVYGKQSTTPYSSTERFPRSVLKFAKDKQKSSLHPTQKPYSLGEYFVKTYSNEGDLILDNAAGSGTYGLAAKNLNRNYIMIEKTLKHFNTCRERLGETVTN
jgi:site-specific DNA-methyltransferase (adenine-specific)